MIEIQWEPIKSNAGTFMQRAKVFGGWLVSHSDDVHIPINEGYSEPSFKTGYEWRISMAFVPDPNHEWK